MERDDSAGRRGLGEGWMHAVWLLDDEDLAVRLRWHQRVIRRVCQACPRRLPECPHHRCPILERHAAAINRYFAETLRRQRAQKTTVSR